MKIVEKLSEKHQEQIVTSVLKRKMNTQTETSGSSKQREIELNLSTSGFKTKIFLNSKKKQKVVFSTER